MHAYAALDAAVAEADNAGFGLAADGDRSPDRMGIARNRLYSLGYLWKDNQLTTPDPAYLGALATFQQEAGLAQSQRLDAASWEALEQLVGFESDTVLSRWYRNGTALPALLRAARLRLTAFGLIDRPAKPTIENLKQSIQERELYKGIADFVRVGRLLRLSDAPLAPDFSRDTLSVLFNQDRLVEQLAQMGRGVRVYYRDGAGRDEIREDRRLVTDFVRGLARIELWLAGFGTKPRRQYPYDHGGAEFTLNQAIPEFWDTQPVALRPAAGERLDVSGHFFFCLQQLADADDGSAQRRMDAVVDQITSDKATADAVKDKMVSLGARLWDGIRRATRWLFAKIFSGIRAVANRVTNMARLIKAAAVRVYNGVRLLLQCCADSIQFMLHTQFRPAGSSGALLVRDRDWDLTLLIDPGAGRAAVTALLTEFVLRCRLFAVSARLTGRLAGMLMAVIRRTLLGGWFGLVLVLARLSSGAHQILRLARSAVQILKRIEPTRIEAI